VVEKSLKPGASVLVKPNISDPLPAEKVSNTHPLFLRALLKLLKKLRINVMVGEASAGGGPGITRKCLSASGIEEVINEQRVPFRNFQEEPFITTRIPNGKILKSAEVAKAVYDVDCIINVPKLKTHGLTFMTGAIKNCFGCVSQLTRKHLHSTAPNRMQFSQGLVDIYSVIKPRLTLMDAVVGMEGEQGPSFGNPKKIGVIIASEDGVAVDAVAASIIGYKPSAIPAIRDATERGIGNGRIEKLEIVGEKIESTLVKDFKKHPLFDNKYRKMEGFGKHFVLLPTVDEIRCSKCGSCANACPVDAIKLAPYPIINRSRCIMCYCCHEVCPVGACRLEIKWYGGKKWKSL
jgi:uncharacterized protein (DUF362 family)/Pyruvate/2-oxoacid:ferredoxin oxidoreductase delta subunit